jgi:hypothetical protein
MRGRKNELMRLLKSYNVTRKQISNIHSKR